LTKQAIKWMHIMCGYPVKSTWLKATKAGNNVGWPVLNERNIQKYYPQDNQNSKRSFKSDKKEHVLHQM
jgi:hypothetical protein